MVNIPIRLVRRLYVPFAVLKYALEALAQHYGHLYTALLDRVYVGSDIELQKLIDKESQAEIAAGLSDLLTANRVAGKAGDAMQSLQATYRSKFRGKKALVSMVKKLIADGVTLAPCDWGYCVYSPDQSACRGDERGPNPIRREPNTCSTCANFAATERHRTWWEDRATREEAFLENTSLPTQSRSISEERLAKTKAVLRSLIQIGTGTIIEKPKK